MTIIVGIIIFIMGTMSGLLLCALLSANRCRDCEEERKEKE